MRIFLIALAAGGCLVGTTAAQENFPKSFYDELKTHNIDLHASFPLAATITLKDANTLKGIELLRAAKSLSYVDLDVQNPAHTDECLKLLAGFPKLSSLQIRNGSLKEKDIERIAGLKALGSLRIEYPEFTEVQLKHLEPLKKTLSFVELRYKNFVAPDLEARLNRALPETYVYLLVDISWRMAKTVNIAANDDQLTKLKKQKFIAAAKALQVSFEVARNGPSSSSGSSSSSTSSSSKVRAHEGCSDFALAATMMKDAILDLDDRQLALELVNDYVRYIEKAHAVCEKRFRDEKNSSSSLSNPADSVRHFVQYSLLDTQILQLQLRKQLEKKTP